MNKPPKPKNRQTRNAEAHHGSAGERHFQRLLQARAGGLRRADVRLGRDLHPDIIRR